MVKQIRKEVDALGTLNLPDNVYYGIQTERARTNFPISGNILSEYPTFIEVLAKVKKATILAHKELGEISLKTASAMLQATDEVIEGKLNKHFPIDMFLGGGGTSLNMNMNEVISNRANEILTGKKGYDKVSPNNHANMSQSTNDVIPSAMRLTMYIKLQNMLKVISKLQLALEKKIEQYKHIVKLSRTCLQDAVPITFGQEFSGYLSYFERQKRLVEEVANDCLIIPLGGTAIGTELGARPGYIDKVYEHLSNIFEVTVKKDPNFFDGIQNIDIFSRVSHTLRNIAGGLSKIGNDFRLFSSGPRAGFEEIVLPALQPGSSIMPGKINPVMTDVVNQVYAQVSGNDHSISIVIEGSEPDIGMASPAVLKWLKDSFKVIEKTIPLFIENCLLGLTVNKERCRKYAESSGALSIVISVLYGYKEGTRVAKYAQENKLTIKEAAIELNIMSEEEAEELLDPLNLTDPDKSKRVLFG